MTRKMKLTTIVPYWSLSRAKMHSKQQPHCISFSCNTRTLHRSFLMH
ncbi:hypothetical protein Pint_30600 [Pistacia integerrima]|uniref:Uncharacterized protein n=1 Tax=Pistacia integerrima TaxID=434235 RepID=A0ACC0X2Y3_9ROSI|nr:hypothetical protein Pint_30600 [Pistacia integerrima]